MKFRKRPVVIDAVLFTPSAELTPGLSVGGVHHSGCSDNGEAMYMVKTLEGHMQIRPGDWLITGTAGELYPCRDSIFKEIYEPRTCGESMPHTEANCTECGHPAKAHPLLDGMEFLK